MGLSESPNHTADHVTCQFRLEEDWECGSGGGGGWEVGGGG